MFRFDPDVGKAITVFESTNVTLSKVLRAISQETVQVGCFYIGPKGNLGYHPATCDQLFLVVQGEGWVRSQDSANQPITAGTAAFWREGEWHESGSDTGMVVIVLEAKELIPEKFMPEA